MLQHLSPTLSEVTSPNIPDENVHNVIKSTEDIINDDFEKIKISEAAFNDFSWSPHSGISPSMMNSNYERKPFDVLNQYSRFPNPLQGLPPIQNFSQENRSFSHNQGRMQLRDIGNLNRMPSEPKLQKAASDTMKHHGQKMTSVPILKLNFTGPPDCELEEKHIRNLFGRFGDIMKIIPAQNRTTYLMLDNSINALTAQKALNKCYLKDLNVTLYVNFCNNLEEDSKSHADSKMDLNIARLQKHHIGNGSDKENDSSAMNMNGNVKRSIYTFSQDLSFTPNANSGAKFTCKYEVQIENEKEFRVAQKIIGSRGYNMKKIIEICQSQVKNPNIIYKSDFLKLRLRGKGSGFKEGPDQKESDEPIHLCVSSRYNDVFETACKLVEELLTYVYKEYDTFCKNRKGSQNLLQIKKSETYSGSTTDRQTPDNYMDMLISPNNYNAYPSPNNNYMFYPNENYPNATTPSPRNNFGVENMYKQFGQERMMNGFSDRVQPSPYKGSEGIGSHVNYHCEW